MSDAESIFARETYNYLLVRGLVLELVRRQRGRLLSIRRAHLFLRAHDLRVKSVFIRDIFLSFGMVKKGDEDGQKELYIIPASLSNAP